MDTRIIFGKDEDHASRREIANINSLDVSMACAFDPHFGAKGIRWSVVKQVRDERLAREGKVYEDSDENISPSYIIGEVNPSRNTLLHAIKYAAECGEQGKVLDCAEWFRELLKRERESCGAVEIGKPKNWKNVIIHTVARENVKEGDVWVTVTRGDKE